MMKIYSSTAVSPQRSTYLNKLKRYHIIVTIVRFLILTGFIAAWEISTRTGVVNPLYSVLLQEFLVHLYLWLKIAVYLCIYGLLF